MAARHDAAYLHHLAHLPVHPDVHVVIAVHAAIVMHPETLHAASRIAVRVVARLMATVLARRPKVSVITPTWKRSRLLTRRCIPSVAAQAYDGPVEHVIVSDGPDPDLAGVPGVTFLPEHRHNPNRGIWARQAGCALATGEFFAYLDDDNAWRPDHLELLVAALERERVSFAYSRAQCWNPYGGTWEIGCQRPVFGQVDTSLLVHRASLMEAAGGWEPSGQPADWDLVERWLAAGATWTYVPAITLDYYARPYPGEPLEQLSANR